MNINNIGKMISRLSIVSRPSNFVAPARTLSMNSRTRISNLDKIHTVRVYNLKATGWGMFWFGGACSVIGHIISPNREIVYVQVNNDGDVMINDSDSNAGLTNNDSVKESVKDS